MDSLLSIVTPAESHDLTTLATVKTEMQITGNTQDERLTAMIHQASGMCASYCNRVFGSEAVEEIFRPGCSLAALSLTRFPVTEIASIVEDSVTLTEGTDFEVDEESGLVYRLNSDERTAWLASKITVNYTGGYELMDDLPDDIERACIELVKVFYHAGPRDPMVKAQSIPGLLSQDYWVGGFGADALPPKVTEHLARYRVANL